MEKCTDVVLEVRHCLHSKRAVVHCCKGTTVLLMVLSEVANTGKNH